ncbi:hypothetical protein Tco_0573962 [Tanacetum coccineum]
MASPKASISKPSMKSKFTIIPLKQLFIDLTNEDAITPSPKLQESSPSSPNAPSKTPSTKDTSSSSIGYTPKSSTLLSSPSTNGYLNSPLSPPPRVPPPPPTQAPNSMEITFSLSPITPLDVHHNSPSLSSPIIGHPIPWNLLEAHGDSCLCYLHNRNGIWVIDLSKNLVQHSRTKHIEIRYHFLCDNVQKGNISIEKVSSEDNIANILTKPLKREPFNYLRLGLGMIEQID